MPPAEARRSGWRIGVDVGGTFTDVVVVRQDGKMHVAKVPSVPKDPEVGVLAGLERVATLIGGTVKDLLSDCTLFVHGSTVATNTLLEGKGATVGMVTTRGFRDVIEIRRGWRPDPWDHRTPFPPPLVPRHLRLSIAARLNRDGTEDQAVDPREVEQCAISFAAEGVESIAVCLFNSFLDGCHEKIVADILVGAQAGPTRDAPSVFCSADVIPIMGEYERWATTVVNAYVAPRTLRYLTRLEHSLKERGLKPPLLLVQNNGGAMTLTELAHRPAALLLSGPAAGIGALRYFGKSVGSHDLISLEIGGTSCDVMVMNAGQVATSDRLTIGGYDLFLPSVDINTIGAGGGTLAGVDAARMLFVGPKGAGAVPGPAAYGLGGEEPTVTDALLVLGRLRPAPLGEGAIVLDRVAAVRAVDQLVAKPLGLDTETAALGIVKLVEQKLLQAVQHLTSARGLDPRAFTLVACGGAGPMHGAALARKLGCRRVCVPRTAGAFCAIGMLNSDVRHDLIRAYLGALDDPKALESAFGELEIEGRERLHRDGFGRNEQRFERRADLRYAGQHWDVTVPVDSGAISIKQMRAAFDREHVRLFGHELPGTPIRVTLLRLSAIGIIPPLQPIRAAGQMAGDPLPIAWQDAVIDDAGTRARVPVFAGAELAPGARINGPALIEERTTTVFLSTGDNLMVGESGDFLLEISSECTVENRSDAGLEWVG